MYGTCGRIDNKADFDWTLRHQHDWNVVDEPYFGMSDSQVTVYETSPKKCIYLFVIVVISYIHWGV